MQNLATQSITLTGVNKSGDTIGRRNVDGAQVVIKQADAAKAGSLHVRNITPTLAHKMYFHKYISDKEIQACEMFQEHHFDAGLQPRTGASYGDTGRSTKHDISDTLEYNKKRFQKAMRALQGYSNIVYNTVIDEQPPCSIPKLKTGLTRLIGYYGI